MRIEKSDAARPSPDTATLQPAEDGSAAQAFQALLPPTFPEDRPQVANIFQDIIRGAQNRSRGTNLDDINDALDAHYLKGSFHAHVEQQLRDYGVIRIGVLDDFSSSTTHGTNVEARLIQSVPHYLRDHVEIVRFDVGGDNEISAMQAAATAARNKDIVALSVSGGLEPINADGLENDLGGPITAANRGQALALALSRNEDSPDYQSYYNAYASLGAAARTVPVVTPVWNDGNTTPAALVANALVTSISGDDNDATDLPGIVDIEIPSLVGNPKTSQSAPRFIGGALHHFSRRDVTDLTR